jgi:SLT domain-containing protein
MTAKQVQQHAQQGLTMQESMVKLSMAFDQLATSLIPLVTPLVKAFSDLLGGLTGAKSPAQVMQDLGTQLKTTGGELVASLLAIKLGLMALRSVGAAPVAGAAEAAAVGAPVAETAAATASTGLWASLGASIRNASGALVGFVASLGMMGVTIAGVTAPLWAVVAAVAAVVAGLVVLITHWQAVTTWVGRVAQALGQWTTSTVVPWIDQVTTHLSAWAQHNQVLTGVIQMMLGPLAILTFHFQTIIQVLPQVSGQIQQWVTQTLASFAHWAGQSALTLNASVTTMLSDLSRWASQAPSQFSQSITTLLGDVGRWTLQAPSQLAQGLTALTARLSQWASQAPSSLQQGLSRLTQALNQWAGGLWSSLGQSFSNLSAQFGNWINNLLKNIGLGGGGSPSQTSPSANVGSWIQQAMRIAGVAGNTWYQGLSQLIAHESGGNPNAVNPLGVNYGGGHGIEHAMGLTQMMPTTFAAYAMPGMTNIMNPINNLVASIRYITSAFGSITNIPGLFGGHYRGYAAGGLITEPIHGIGARSGSHYLFGEGGNEMITPLSGGGRSGPSGGIALTVNVNAMSNDPRTLAQQVANVLVQELKRHGNFAF